jgi:esterase/lipase
LSKGRLTLAALALAVAALWLLTPARLGFDPEARLPALPATTFISGTEERVLQRNASTWVVVALHGFSASRQETAPLAEIVARRLGASLIEARLSGHGHAERPLVGVLAEHWLRDVHRVLMTASELGDRTIVIGTSTGATAAVALLDQDIAGSIDTLVMISPNFEPRDANARWLTRPAGPYLARLMVDDTRCWTPHNPEQARYWTTCYPMSAAVEMMRLVDRANRILPAKISQRLLMFYSPDDEVVSPDAALRIFNETVSPAKEAVEIRDPGDPSSHVLAGDILSPETTLDIADAIVDFIERPAP